MEKIQIVFTGRSIPAEDLMAGNEEFVVESSFQLSTDRGIADLQKLDIGDDRLIQLTSMDGVEWICYGDDIPELTATNSFYSRSGQQRIIEIPAQIMVQSGRGTRDGTGFSFNRLDIIKNDLVSKAAHELAELIERRAMHSPGLKRVTRTFQVVPEDTITTRTHYLLMLHGTFASTQGSFNKFPEDRWQSIHDHYQGRVLGWDHYTVKHSPYKNVLDLLQLFPEEIKLTLVSASRGGLLADVLARCDHRNPIRGFTDDEIRIIEEDAVLQAEEMRQINLLANTKRIEIDKVIRVASPASGTILLDQRLDHFLNGLMNVIRMALGGKFNPLYGVVKSFLLAIVRERYHARSFPGLWAMVPETSFQQVNNNNFQLSSALYAVAGDAEVGHGLWNSLKVILTNLYYREANDFVVNTRAMTRGLLNRAICNFLRIEQAGINHFAYFHFRTSSVAITQALTRVDQAIQGFTSLHEFTQGRGVALSLLNLGELKSEQVTGRKPIVVLLPGIMGSNLYRGDHCIWLDFPSINRGEIKDHLNINEPGILAKSVVHKYYHRFKESLDADYDVLIMPFDWRKSVDEVAKEVDTKLTPLFTHQQPIYLVTHSMGGIVARAWKQQFGNSWKRFKELPNAKWIMLGTPWLGSYLIMEVLTGHSRRVRQLSLLDFRYSKKALLNVFNRYPGIYELLPVNEKEMEKPAFWKTVLSHVKEQLDAPPNKLLNHFGSYKDELLKNAAIDAQDEQVIYYIAGLSESTTDGYELAESFFQGKYLKYTTTQEGDGSVTWAMGIPPGLKPGNLYYSRIEHGNLANSPEVIGALKDLFRSGYTNKLSTSKPSVWSRGLTEPGPGLAPATLAYHEPDVITDNLFGVTPAALLPKVAEVPLQVEVFNGDLKWSQFPVMIGHFANDGIVSAERTLDAYLGGKLFEHKQLGFYPGEIGEQALIYDEQGTPLGAIVIGLGNKDMLTGFELALSVEKAVLRYALFFRDTHPDKETEAREGISTLLVGSAYGRLPMVESVRSIILGVQRANALILGLDNGLKPIKTVEFVDYYQDNAYECYKILSQLREEKNTIFIELKEEIERGFGNRSRLLREESRSWWQSMTTTVEKNDPSYPKPYLKYSAYGGLANVPMDKVLANMELAAHLADTLSVNQKLSLEASKAIFELLIPNSFKDFIRNHRNIEWKMDIEAARFPWEMFHDSNYGQKPTFVEAGLIRQLYADDVVVTPALVTNRSALVIGDPNYHDDQFPPLDGAYLEAEKVAEILDQNNMNVELLRRCEAEAIIQALYAKEHKLLHVAGHGIFKPEEHKVGIVIGKDLFLDPGTIRQLSAIPEFVFINCCYSGQTDSQRELYMQHRHRLAANIGTEFIRIGVKAVVVAGWAVNDAAALLFAQKLYSYLYLGAYFGDAIRKAREDCYTEFPQYNTWGAYQCYGDQFYRLKEEQYHVSVDDRLTLESEISMELDNILSETYSVNIVSGTSARTVRDIRERTQRLVGRAGSIGKFRGHIVETEGKIYAQLGQYQAAIESFRQLLLEDDSDFGIQVLDHYCNIRAKKLANEVLGLQPGQSILPFRKELEGILNDLNKQMTLGETFNRMTSFGSTYKRAAIIEPTQALSREYLEKAAGYYKKAWNKAVKPMDKIYPATSYYTLMYFHCDGAIDAFNSKLAEEQIEPAVDFLAFWLDEVDHIKISRSNLWGQLAKIQLNICKLVIEDVRNGLLEKILDLYDKQVTRCINIKDLFGEIEHMRFLALMFKRLERQDHVDAFNKIRDKLESWM